jgi:hypothetical protein
VTGTSSSGANSARETTVIDACQQLVMTLRAQPEQKAVFVGEDGIAALMELLEERSAKVFFSSKKEHQHAEVQFLVLTGTSYRQGVRTDSRFQQSLELGYSLHLWIYCLCSMPCEAAVDTCNRSFCVWVHK